MIRAKAAEQMISMIWARESDWRGAESVLGEWGRLHSCKSLRERVEEKSGTGAQELNWNERRVVCRLYDVCMMYDRAVRVRGSQVFTLICDFVG